MAACFKTTFVSILERAVLLEIVKSCGNNGSWPFLAFICPMDKLAASKPTNLINDLQTFLIKHKFWVRHAILTNKETKKKTP